VKKLLLSPVPKIGWNIKYEDRWFAAMGVSVNNWAWDGMQAAHVLDHRPGITGLKFQAYVRLGQSSYGDRVHPMLEASSGNDPNRIRQVDLRELLLYNGLDSLLTYNVAVAQRKELCR
jgi:hypothetical protein